MKAQNLSKAEVERFRQKLELHRSEAREFLRHAEQEQKELETERPPELGDFCVASSAREYLFERASQQRRLLNRIERALQRVQAGAFGACINCGGEIPHKRLTAMPWTDYCLRCQDERERRTASNPVTIHVGHPQRAA